MSSLSVAVADWGVIEVAEWLGSIGFAQYKQKFAEQQITGQDLLDLTEADLMELGFTTLGQRKKIQRKIGDLAHSQSGFTSGFDDRLSSHSDSMSDHDSVVSGSSQKSSESAKERRIKVKCYYKKDIRVLTIKPTTNYKALSRKIREEYNRTLEMFWEDDGDSIKIASDRQLQNVIKLSKDTVKINLQRKSRKSSSSSSRKSSKTDSQPQQDFSLLDSLVDACVVIESDGYITFFNSAAERTFGYQKSEVVGKNVNILMTDMYAARHDSYLVSYLRTGQKKIIGTTRNVLGKHKSGKTIGLELSVSESKTGSQHTFTAMLKLSSDDQTSDGFSLLDGLLESVICIDDSGTILHANPKALGFFGYTSADLIGQNVSMLMPNPHRDNHNNYLNQYRHTGKTTVIGKTRDTVCELSDGTICPISLSVSENKVGNKKHFIGTISKRDQSSRKISMLVQQRQVIETLATPAIIIDSKCIIQAFNQSALRVLRYNLDEVLGQNVSMIVGGPHAVSHDKYVESYLTSGVAKVIGKDRKLPAKAKDGRETAIILTVTEFRDGDRVFFTGMFFKPS